VAKGGSGQHVARLLSVVGLQFGHTKAFFRMQAFEDAEVTGPSR
jgi:hypothetical protein